MCLPQWKNVINENESSKDKMASLMEFTSEPEKCDEFEKQCRAYETQITTLNEQIDDLNQKLKYCVLLFLRHIFPCFVLAKISLSQLKKYIYRKTPFLLLDTKSKLN